MKKLDKDMKPWTWSKLICNKEISYNDIINDYENSLIFKEQFLPYMIFQFFSNSVHFNLIANRMNSNFLLCEKPDYLYKYLYYSIPKNNQFIKWVKKNVKTKHNLILSKKEWDSIYPDMPFDKIDSKIMEFIQKEMKSYFKEIKKEMKP